MNRVIVLLFAIFTAVVANLENEMICAIVRLEPHNVAIKNVTGHLRLMQSEKGEPVRIVGKIYGLTEGLHGFHVHQKGDLSNGCTSTGAHYNPTKADHGAPDSAVRHVGDLGNIRADEYGEANVDITDSIISLTGRHRIIGRAIVVHSGQDDLGRGGSPLSLTTGNSGDRWACGIIGVLEP